MSKLRECGDEGTALVEELLGKYDVRIVLPVLGVRFAEVAAAALAAGIARRYVLDVLIGVLDCTLTPQSEPPAVTYLDGDEILGRKH